MIITRGEINEMEKIERLNLINSITGVKPANLIGTISGDGLTNLAIFSSVIHLGSNPPLIGMISRPDANIRRHTLENLKQTKQYSINHLPISHAEKGHYTSAKFDDVTSEFDACGFTAAFTEDYTVPYVQESPVSLIMKLTEIVPIKANGTVMIIGELMQLLITDDSFLSNGQLDLQKAQVAGIGGIDSYYKLTKIAQYPYARVNDLPNFDSNEI